MRRKREGIACAAIVAGVALGVTAWIAHEPVLLAIGDYLTIQDRLEPADVIHVISGPDYRTDHAIRLYTSGYGKVIFFTGGWCSTIQGNHAERGEARAAEQGVPGSSVAMDGSEVISTYAEVVRLQEFIAHRSMPVRSVIVVSDPFHMRRARWAYKKVLGPGIRVEMAPVPFDATPYQRRWWNDAASRQYVAQEYVKIVYYFARYQLGLGPINNWLAALDRE